MSKSYKKLTIDLVQKVIMPPLEKLILSKMVISEIYNFFKILFSECFNMLVLIQNLKI